MPGRKTFDPPRSYLGMRRAPLETLPLEKHCQRPTEPCSLPLCAGFVPIYHPRFLEHCPTDEKGPLLFVAELGATAKITGKLIGEQDTGHSLEVVRRPQPTSSIYHQLDPFHLRKFCVKSWFHYHCPSS